MSKEDAGKLAKAFKGKMTGKKPMSDQWFINSFPEVYKGVVNLLVELENSPVPKNGDRHCGREGCPFYADATVEEGCGVHCLYYGPHPDDAMGRFSEEDIEREYRYGSMPVFRIAERADRPVSEVKKVVKENGWKREKFRKRRAA